MHQKKWPRRVWVIPLVESPAHGKDYGCPACQTALVPPAKSIDHTASGWLATYRCATCQRHVLVPLSDDLAHIDLSRKEAL